MASSGIPWIDATFEWCVAALYWVGKLIGMTYEEVNVWLFVVGWPVVTLVMAGVIWHQWRTIRRLKRASSKGTI